MSPNTDFSFSLPKELEATMPPEDRGIQRDQVKLLVSSQKEQKLVHTTFTHIVDLLHPGDTLVVNISSTLNAAIPLIQKDLPELELRLCTALPSNIWVVEISEPGEDDLTRIPLIDAGKEIQLYGGGMVKLHTPYRQELRMTTGIEPVRLWIATLTLPTDLPSYLDLFGSPIRYRYVKKRWGRNYYQTIFGAEPGSVEMLSAGRAFTHELVTKLIVKGIQIAPILLHCGLSSLGPDEPLVHEYYRVPPETAHCINSAKGIGKRIIAVGTTVLRALETVVDQRGHIHGGEGWTQLAIRPSDEILSIDGLLTGFHEPQASHLSILSALMGEEQLREVYSAAVQNNYLWHEFGDLHLIFTK